MADESHEAAAAAAIVSTAHLLLHGLIPAFIGCSIGSSSGSGGGGGCGVGSSAILLLVVVVLLLLLYTFL